MEHHGLADAAVTVSLALAVGMVAQSIARHLNIPGIVLLLGAGVLLGPDVADIVRPQMLGPGLRILVGFAVAVILFEGALSLDLRRLAHQARLIQRLLTLGAVITAAGGTLAAWWIMRWDWRLALLFGTLVIVTGPTVITPLLRRIKVRHRVETVLEAEGVLIDAIGAVIAVVALQVVISPSGSSLAMGALSILSRLVFGAVVGVAGGFLLAFLLRFRKVVPEGLENVFTLSLVLALFQICNAVVEESGLMAVTAAGMVMGNVHTRVLRDLMEFKEQLTVMFIGMLFVLLAADVRIAEVQALGLPGLLTVAALMFVVRPLNIAACTVGSDLSLKEKTFLAWLSPRGVVAAAIASFFAQTIDDFGIEGGSALRALVFMVIAITVVVQGMTGGVVASLLGQRRAVSRGFAILGANELGHTLGRLLRDSGEEVVFLDNSPSACKVVEADGFKVVYGNALEERTLQRAQVGDRAGLIAVTQNDEVNLLVGRMAIEDFKVGQVHVAVRRSQSNVNRELIRAAGGSVLFGRPRDLELWALRLRRGIGLIEAWRLERAGGAEGGEAAAGAGERAAAAPIGPARDAEGAEGKAEREPFQMPEGLLLPLVCIRGKRVWPVHGLRPVRPGDIVWFCLLDERQEEARTWLREQGWIQAEVEPVAAAES